MIDVHQDDMNGHHITSYDGNSIVIGDKVYTEPILLCPHKGPTPWQIESFEGLEESHIMEILKYPENQPDVLLFGSGAKQHWLPHKLLEFCYAKNIGVEVMLTRSACRTYNAMLADGHKLLGAFVI